MSACVTAVEATSFKSSTDLLIDIHSLIESFETIQRALEAFLETKRNIFPRFYFLSNDDLLEVQFHTFGYRISFLFLSFF